MPGSILNVCPGSEGSGVPRHDVRILVRLGADAVTGAMHEVLAVPRVGDHRPRRRVDGFTRGADGGRAHAALLGFHEHRVRVPHLGGRFSHTEHAGDVGAVAVHRAAEVAQHDIAGCDHAVGRIVVRARRVGPGGDDGEVGALVTGVEHALDELPVDVDLAPAREALGAHGFGDRVDRDRRGTQRVDLGRVLDDAQRSGDVDRTAEVRARQRGLQLDDEARPGVIADRGGGRLAHEPGDDGDRVLGLFPRADRERVGPLDDAWRLEARHHEHRVAVGREDEHRESLERHRLVTGEVRQVGARRQQQHVDPQAPASDRERVRSESQCTVTRTPPDQRTCVVRR